MKPAAQLPDVYMPGVPSSCVERRGALPAAPASGRTLAMPRQTGVVAVGVRDGDGVRFPDGLPVPERVAEPLPVNVRVCDGLTVLVCELEALPLHVLLEV